MPRCKARTKSGDQCRNNAIPGTEYCYISSHGQIVKPFLKKWFNFFQNNWQLAIAIISLCLAVAGVYWRFYDKWIAATAGKISSPIQSAGMSISVGSAEFRMLSKDGVVFIDGSDPLLSIALENGKLVVSTQVRDENGNIVAEMSQNEWKHQPEPAILDRNYTQDALEIRDRAGKIILQVANVGPTIDLAAIFHCKNGWTYMVGPIAGVGSAIELRPPGKPLTYEISPICEYPSDLHFAVCPGIERLRQLVTGPHTTYPLYFPVHFCL